MEGGPKTTVNTEYVPSDASRMTFFTQKDGGNGKGINDGRTIASLAHLTHCMEMATQVDSLDSYSYDT